MSLTDCQSAVTATALPIKKRSFAGSVLPLRERPEADKDKAPSDLPDVLLSSTCGTMLGQSYSILVTLLNSGTTGSTYSAPF